MRRTFWDATLDTTDSEWNGGLPVKFEMKSASCLLPVLLLLCACGGARAKHQQ